VASLTHHRHNLGEVGRWTFAGFTSVFDIAADFEKLIQSITNPAR
jgi:hypothetical protein